MVAGFNEQGLAANVAEYYGIPLVALHLFPGGFGIEWLDWRITKEAEDTQRRHWVCRRQPAPRALCAGDPGLRRVLLARAGSGMGGPVADVPSSGR